MLKTQIVHLQGVHRNAQHPNLFTFCYITNKLRCTGEDIMKSTMLQGILKLQNKKVNT